MALILSIETATSICSVALHIDGMLLCLAEVNQENVHASKLVILIEELFAKSGAKPSDLSAIAISSGPGSYTGLRIGVSVAKGMAFAFDIPLIAVDTLVGLAFQALPMCAPQDFVIPLLDARRMEVYTNVMEANGKILLPSHPLEIQLNPFEKYLEAGKVFFLGDGLDKLKEILVHPNANFLPNLNSADSIGQIAFEKLQKEEFVDIAYFEPNYLKEFKVIASRKNPLLI